MGRPYLVYRPGLGLPSTPFSVTTVTENGAHLGLGVKLRAPGGHRVTPAAPETYHPSATRLDFRPAVVPRRTVLEVRPLNAGVAFCTLMLAVAVTLL
jgi:hypothetical protein